MFGLDFLFAAALFALPLAAAPLLLHLLFKRKSPTVQFSTLRFIRASVQHTAARRRLQRWLLLACRILLLALLIWTVAQPVKRLKASWAGGSRSTIAAVVVDTSYSMQLREKDGSLLQRADWAVQDLLRDELKDARVALFTSAENAEHEALVSASSMQSQWTPLAPGATRRTLADRIAAARTMLSRQVADQKWLLILSDLQSREFPRPLENVADVRTVWLDLHPDTPRSAGITGVSINPPQPIPGIGSELAIQATGHSAESRAIAIRLLRPDGGALLQPPPAMASFGAGALGTGRTTVRMPIRLPAEPWVIAEARFPEEDAMPWDDSRATLVRLPPRQRVCVIDQAAGSSAARFVRLALDPSEGTSTSWPLEVRSVDAPTDGDRVAIVLLSRWPDQPLADRLATFAQSGRTVILFLQPGIESTWKDLPEAQRAALMKLLPAEPADATLTSPAHLLPSGDQFADLLSATDAQSAQFRRLIQFSTADRAVRTILNAGTDTSRKLGVAYQRPLGSGQVYTFATMPDARFTNLATHPIFLPMLVRLSLQPPQQRGALNAQIGEEISLDEGLPVEQKVTIETPAKETFQVEPAPQSTRRVFKGTKSPGLYTWRAGAAIVGYSNVTPPAAESELVYRPAESIAGRADNVLVARSLDELRTKIQQLAEPEPRWSWAMALVLVMLCVEAMLGSLSGISQTRKAASGSLSPVPRGEGWGEGQAA